MGGVTEGSGSVGGEAVEPAEGPADRGGGFFPGVSRCDRAPGSPGHADSPVEAEPSLAEDAVRLAAARPGPEAA
ncbi:hypothetical protein ACFWF5_28740, partial [Streptomyces diastaticus]